jgi:hypothetical protein
VDERPSNEQRFAKAFRTMGTPVSGHRTIDNLYGESDGIGGEAVTDRKAVVSAVDHVPTNTERFFEPFADQLVIIST